MSVYAMPLLKTLPSVILLTSFIVCTILYHIILPANLLLLYASLHYSIHSGYVSEFARGMDLTIVPRKEWSGTDVEVYKAKEKPVRPAPIVYFGSTMTQPCVEAVFCAATLRLMQFTHFKKFPTDIPFK